MARLRPCSECAAICQGTLCATCFGRPATEANLTARFWRLVNRSDDCWLWTGGRGGRRGLEYGIFRRTPGAKHEPAHRIAYELLVGPIPEGFQLDHLCKTTLCV